MNKLRIFRKRGGRSYQYKEGTAIPKEWHLQDEKGNKYATFEEYQEANKPKPVAKKKVVKKAVDTIKKD